MHGWKSGMNLDAKTVMMSTFLHGMPGAEEEAFMEGHIIVFSRPVEHDTGKKNSFLR
jgi:hypothetical protein